VQEVYRKLIENILLNLTKLNLINTLLLKPI
jgi:hypothetical protein